MTKARRDIEHIIQVFYDVPPPGWVVVYTSLAPVTPLKIN